VKRREINKDEATLGWERKLPSFFSQKLKAENSGRLVPAAAAGLTTSHSHRGTNDGSPGAPDSRHHPTYTYHSYARSLFHPKIAEIEKHLIRSAGKSEIGRIADSGRA
jgi:hypothetical protein